MYHIIFYHLDIRQSNRISKMIGNEYHDAYYYFETLHYVLMLCHVMSTCKDPATSHWQKLINIGYQSCLTNVDKQAKHLYFYKR